MSTPHIAAKKGEIAQTVLLPGDPLRARWVAKNFLKGAVCYNTVRGMLGYTGKKNNSGERVSVQGTGIGMASLSIYVNELVDVYGVKKIIRIGSGGGLQERIQCRSIFLVQGSCSDSAMSARKFPPGIIFCPLADWKLLLRASGIAKKMGIKVEICNNFSTDSFYDPSNPWKVLAKYGVMTIEMESAELYTLAAQKGIQALTILTISDNMITHERLTSEERESSFSDMVKLALAI